MVVWHGTQNESFDLQTAVSRNCGCQYGTDGLREGPLCAAHQGMTTDQRWLNGLLFMRRQRVRLEAEEFLERRRDECNGV